MKAFLIVLALIAISGCTGITGNTVTGAASAAVVETGDHVAVHYTGTLEDGSTFDSSVGREPLEFDVGMGQMIKGFDAAVLGMSVGDKKLVTISPEDAYGHVSPENIIEVPNEGFPEGVEVGDTLYANGRPVTVVKINEDTVTIDANHFLAGKTLTFEIEMVSIEKV